jgi:hypothetical protein
MMSRVLFAANWLLRQVNKEMFVKIKILLKKSFWLLVIAAVSALALPACKNTDEHPKNSEHPTSEHPTEGHAATNAPAQKP